MGVVYHQYRKKAERCKKCGLIKRTLATVEFGYEETAWWSPFYKKWFYSRRTPPCPEVK